MSSNEWAKEGDNLFRHITSGLWLTYIDGSPVLFRWDNTSTSEVVSMLNSLRSLPKPKPASVPPPGM